MRKMCSFIKYLLALQVSIWIIFLFYSPVCTFEFLTEIECILQSIKFYKMRKIRALMNEVSIPKVVTVNKFTNRKIYHKNLSLDRNKDNKLPTTRYFIDVIESAFF